MPKYTKSELDLEIAQLKQQLREREREREGRSLRKLLVYLLNIFALSWFHYPNYHHYQKSQ